LDDGKKNDDDEKEEGYVEHYAVHFIFVAVWRLNFITDTTTSSNTLMIFIKLS